MAHFRLLARSEQAALLELPWAVPLEEWRDANAPLVDVVRGIGRHVVRFVSASRRVFALKELPPRIAAREYRLLRRARAAERAVGRGRGHRRRAPLRRRRGAATSILITRYLEFSLPYRALLGRRALPAPEPAIRAALAELLVRLHLRASSGATARSRTRSSAATPARSRRTSSTPRRASCTRASPTASARTTSTSREENIVGELLDLAAELGRDVVERPDRVRRASPRAATTSSGTS